MTLYEELRGLHDEQRKMEDGYRLFHDGSVKTATVTDSLETGWYILARPIPGASSAFRSYFPRTVHGMFLKVESMREAISLRDRMLETVVASKLQRRLEMDLLSADQHKIEPGRIPDSF